MPDIDQSRFDNQHGDWIGAAEASEILEVKRATLYAYVSRGLVTARGQRRSRVYKREDIERLALRRDARRGHRAVAAAALRWGEPVLDTSISEIGPDLRYRGRSAVDLALECSFESVAELLWTGELADSAPWQRIAAHRKARVKEGAPLLAMRALPPQLAMRDEARLGSGLEAELGRARSLIVSLTTAIGRSTTGSIASMLVGDRARARARKIDLVNAALILSADHGLNVSTFAARVAASAGADLYACCSAALAAFSGPLHGGACEELELLLRRCTTPARTRQLIDEIGRLGKPLVGFGHPLYRDGDVRAAPLLALARGFGKSERSRRIGWLLSAARSAEREPPTIDLAVVAATAALGWPLGHATALFAIGRAAGWIAHVLEQRRAGYMLRPRARFVGSDST